MSRTTLDRTKEYQAAGEAERMALFIETAQRVVDLERALETERHEKITCPACDGTGYRTIDGVFVECKSAYHERKP
jgi:hypothetical protein